MTCPLTLAIVHYHLRPGGVGRVIEQAVAALADHPVRLAVLTGEPPAHSSPLADRACVVRALAYDRPGHISRPDRLYRELTDAARRALGRLPDLWHFHNPTLGKNAALPAVIARLAGQGHPLVLQLHDFAEDGRPANYRHLLRYSASGQAQALDRLLYPQADHVQYLLLNRRDADLLADAGARPDRLQTLPNAVNLPDPPDPGGAGPSGSGRLLLYPVRGIRRKNLGEFLLWAVLGRPDDRFAVTLPATSANEKPFYDRWKQFARQNALAVEFELGLTSGRPFVQLLDSADALVSTSIAEGFGLAFLEPWLIGRPLIGRDLPDITADFTANGLDLHHLYQRLDVPDDWLDPAELDHRLRRALTATRAAYGQPTDEHHLQLARQTLVGRRGIDFGRLDEPLQQRILQRLLADPACRAELADRGLDRQLDPARRLVDGNRRVVRTCYNPDRYGRRLHRIYLDLLDASPGPLEWLPASAVLARFVHPARFHLLRAVHD